MTTTLTCRAHLTQVIQITIPLGVIKHQVDVDSLEKVVVVVVATILQAQTSERDRVAVLDHKLATNRADSCL